MRSSRCLGGVNRVSRLVSPRRPWSQPRSRRIASHLLHSNLCFPFSIIPHICILYLGYCCRTFYCSLYRVFVLVISTLNTALHPYSLLRIPRTLVGPLVWTDCILHIVSHFGGNLWFLLFPVVPPSSAPTLPPTSIVRLRCQTLQITATLCIASLLSPRFSRNLPPTSVQPSPYLLCLLLAFSNK